MANHTPATRQRPNDVWTFYDGFQTGWIGGSIVALVVAFSEQVGGFLLNVAVGAAIIALVALVVSVLTIVCLIPRHGIDTIPTFRHRVRCARVSTRLTGRTAMGDRDAYHDLLRILAGHRGPLRTDTARRVLDVEAWDREQAAAADAEALETARISDAADEEWEARAALKAARDAMPKAWAKDTPVCPYCQCAAAPTGHFHVGDDVHVWSARSADRRVDTPKVDVHAWGVSEPVAWTEDDDPVHDCARCTRCEYHLCTRCRWSHLHAEGTR